MSRIELDNRHSQWRFLMNCRDDRCNSIPTVSLHSRRGIISALASVAVLSPGLSAAATDASADDERFMRIALDEARQADFPFGAVIVRDGQVLARGRNLGRTNGDPTAHGEMTAIHRCLVDHGSAALRGSTLYTSGRSEEHTSELQSRPHLVCRLLLEKKKKKKK